MKRRFIKVIKDMIYRFRDDNVPALSSQLSYSIIASFFPFLIFLMTLSAMLNINDEIVLGSLKVLLPGDAFNLIQNTVIEVLNIKRPHLLSFSLATAIFSSAAGINAIIRGLNKAYDEAEKRRFYTIWLISLVGTVVLALAIILSLVLLIFGALLGDYLQCCLKFSGAIRMLWDIVRFVLSMIILILIFAASYRFLPSRKLNWKEVFPGALFSTLGWAVASIVFSYYVNNFSSYSAFYGSLGAVFILMTWLYISCAIIIIGGELNASLVYSKLEHEAKNRSSASNRTKA